MAALECNLSRLECDEMEWEGLPSAGHLPLYQGEVLLVMCLVVLTAVFYGVASWHRFSSARKSKKRATKTEPASPPEAPVSPPGGANRPPWPGSSAGASREPGLVAALAGPSAAGDPASAARPSLSPTLAFTRGLPSFSPSPPSGLGSRRGVSPSPLFKAPSGLLMRLSELGQKLGLPHRAALASLRQVAGKAGRSKEGMSPGTRYGLGLGEAESADEEEEDDLTSAQLRALEKTPEFHRYLQGKGLTQRDVVTVGSRLRLYKRLRELDPAGFRMLCRADTLRSFETQDPSRWVLFLEYLFTLAANVVGVAAAHFSWAHGDAPPLLRAACAAGAWWLTGAAWAKGRSRGGMMLGLWYQELAWGRGIPPWRAAAASILELVFLFGTFGMGALVSLWMRCANGSAPRRAGMGERCVGVRQVREVAVAAEG